MRGLRLEHADSRIIAAAIVHHQDLVGLAAPVEIGDDLGQVRWQAQRLVIGGNDYRPAWCSHVPHGTQDQIGMSARARRRATPVR